ncbi:MAG: WG repeat-containing protein [Tannerella sp.]|nr:WG repeat-containing protein [Tannerella sp.]
MLKNPISRGNIAASIAVWMFFSCVQKYEGALYPVVDKKTFLWGYADSTRKQVIPCKYGDAGVFHEGLARIESNGKWGYINRKGKKVIPLLYDEACDFHEGFARIESNGKWGYVNRKGKKVIPLLYDEVFDFHEGRARVGMEEEYLIYNDREDLYKDFRPIYGYINREGKKITRLKYEEAENFREGLAMVTSKDKTGWIDSTGREVIPLKYDGAYDFAPGENITVVWCLDTAHPIPRGIWLSPGEFLPHPDNSVRYENLYGFIDRTGKEIIPLKYDFAGNFVDGLSCVELGDKYGFIDRTGKEAIPLKYDFAESFEYGMSRVKLNGKYGFIDSTERVVIPLKYDGMESFSEGLALAGLNGKYGYINKAGEIIIPLKYDAGQSFNTAMGMAAAWVQSGGKHFLIDRTGKRIGDYE